MSYVQTFLKRNFNFKENYHEIFTKNLKNKSNGSININLDKIKKLNENYEQLKNEKNLKKSLISLLITVSSLFQY